MSKIIQENFGEVVIQAIGQFAKADLPTVQYLEQNEFSHVADANLKRALAETFYGARWIYKVGLALLVKDEEQMAHVRAQILDYGAVSEGLLSDVILHGITTNRMRGQKHRFQDTRQLRRPINWNVQNKLEQLTKQSFHWHIEVCLEENIIGNQIAARLHQMRAERNTIHLRSRTHRAFIGTSKSLFDTAIDVIRTTKAWRRNNP